jgi:hypothetical protein
MGICNSIDGNAGLWQLTDLGSSKSKDESPRPIISCTIPLVQNYFFTPKLFFLMTHGQTRLACIMLCYALGGRSTRQPLLLHSVGPNLSLTTTLCFPPHLSTPLRDGATAKLSSAISPCSVSTARETKIPRRQLGGKKGERIKASDEWQSFDRGHFHSCPSVPVFLL